MAKKHTLEKNGTMMVIASKPDVCLTPIGKKVVPIPYISYSYADNVSRDATTVRSRGRNEFTANTRFNTTFGHEPGVKKGVSDPGYKGPCAPMDHSPSVFIEGHAVIRHEEKFGMNMSSMDGEKPKRTWKAKG